MSPLTTLAFALCTSLASIGGSSGSAPEAVAPQPDASRGGAPQLTQLAVLGLFERPPTMLGSQLGEEPPQIDCDALRDQIDAAEAELASLQWQAEIACALAQYYAELSQRCGEYLPLGDPQCEGVHQLWAEWGHTCLDLNAQIAAKEAHLQNLYFLWYEFCAGQ